MTDDLIASILRDAESIRVFADGKNSVDFGQWREWRRACFAEGRTIPPAEFKARNSQAIPSA